MAPSPFPSSDPSVTLSGRPSQGPSVPPSQGPSDGPTSLPSSKPSLLPSSNPSSIPSLSPSFSPSSLPSGVPIAIPSSEPSQMPSTCDSGKGVGSCAELNTTILNATDPINRAEIELCNDIICSGDLDMTNTYFRLSCRDQPCEIDLNGNGFVTQWNSGDGSDFCVTFDGVTITGGDVENRLAIHQPFELSKKRGGAISALGTRRNATSCIELINTTIRDSCAPTGGGVYIRNSNFILRDSQCLNNTATNGRGGCARIAGYTTSTIDNSTFDSNCAKSSGGALHYYNGVIGESEDPATHVISDSIFSNNEVKSSYYGVGGSITAIKGELRFSDLEFWNNSAASGGALALLEYPEPYSESRRRLDISKRRTEELCSPETRACTQIDAELENAKFSGNVARNMGRGPDIYVEDKECCYINVTCNDATEFCDACNSTTFTSTNYQFIYSNREVCVNSIKSEEVCLGGSCENTDECSTIYPVATTFNCSSANGASGNVCCIEPSQNCVGKSEFPGEKCCGDYVCTGDYGEQKKCSLPQ
uniref:Uncharacterized protein n=1 Tax=Minutocellus polymorphus TaxID=265543 RepID=A0A7S0FLN2_9STRA